MAVQDLSTLYTRTFEQNLRSLSQQRGSKLRGCVVERNAPDMHLWDRIAKLSVSSRTAGGSTNETALTLTRRRSKPSSFDVGALVDPDGVAQYSMDPTSSVLAEQKNAIARKIDNIIVTAALGATEAEDGTSTAFPSSAQSLGSATQAFDFNFILSVNAKFLANDVPLEEPKVFVIRPNAVTKILAMSQSTSSDYVNSKALATDGFVDNWLGYTWIVSNELPNVTGSQYYYLAMTKRAVGLHVTKDIWARVAESTEKSFAWRIYSAFSMGATRIEDEHVVRCHVLES